MISTYNILVMSDIDSSLSVPASMTGTVEL